MAAAAFDAALETAERSVVEAELAELRAQLPRVDADFRAASERVGAAEATLAQLDGGARAAELGAGVESRRAELRGLVEQYAVVTLSRALLERQVARFQERHQPRLRRGALDAVRRADRRALPARLSALRRRGHLRRRAR